MDWGQFDQEGALKQRFIEIDERTEVLKKQINRLPGGMPTFLENYDISLIYHENGLEGVVLSYPEIKSSVDNKIISDVSLLPTYQYIKNQKTCIDMMREKAATKRFVVTVPFLEEMHGILLGDPEQAKEYRKDIPIHRTYFHEIAVPAKIQASLVKVLDFLKSRHDKDVHTVELAASVHHRFMRVFPFSDFSGIIGRLLCNFVLMRAGYLPLIVHASDRQRYYEALRGTERDYRLFTAEAVESSLENTARFLEGAPEVRRRVAR